jgi:hypothetical protein
VVSHRNSVCLGVSSRMSMTVGDAIGHPGTRSVGVRRDPLTYGRCLPPTAYRMCLLAYYSHDILGSADLERTVYSLVMLGRHGVGTEIGK